MRTNRQLWTRCPNGLWLLMSSSPMEYSPILHHLHAGPPSSPSPPPSPSASSSSSSSNHVRNKLFVLCIMLSLWVYMVYCCVGYCATIPTPAVSRSTTTSIITTSIITSISTTITGSEARRGGSLGAPRDLLNDDTEADSRGGGDDWDEGKDMGKDTGKTGLSLNGSDSESQRLPQAIIIGVKKGGTRALLEFLRAHPDIRAVGAEPHFFDRNYHKGLEWYRDLMPKTMEGQLTMEKTPSYYVTKEVPARIYNMSKHTKLIVVVRDPVTRAISDYTQTRSKKPDIPSFESLAFRNATPASGGGGGGGVIDATWSAVQIGMYAKHLERWRRYFPAEQLLFVSGEQLISDPAGEMARVQDFLGLRQEVTDRHFHFDAAKGFPCLKRPEGNSKPHCLGKTKGRTHPNIDAAVVQRLREFYQPYNRKFYQMTGHDFGWD